MKLNLARMPDQPKTYIQDIPNLSGGLNIWELDYRIDPNQSPNLKNLWWQDGVLQSRDGQQYIYGPSENQMKDQLPPGTMPWRDLGVGRSCYSSLFWGYALFHIGNKLYYADHSVEPYTLRTLYTLAVPAGSDATERGTFFRYGDWLLYKCRGNFVKISYNPDADPHLSASDLTQDAYSPVIVINATPKNGSGSLYQPENRLSPMKTIRYNAWNDTVVVTRTGTGSQMTFSLGLNKGTNHLAGIQSVYVGNDYQVSTAFSVNIVNGTVTFTDAPANGAVITFNCLIGATEYHLPVQEIDEVVTVKVDGSEKTEDTDYFVDLDTGVITFTSAPPVTNPPTNNTVEITYSKENPDAYNAIMDCPYAIVGGGDTNLCIILGGCDAQPNAIFWNSNDNLSMNPAYWPMSYYNLVGDTEDRVTGFGMQYKDIIVFKTRSIGKLNYGVEVVDARDSISFTYLPVNAKTGCDLPWSIQLIENNLVFCNTYQGVHILRSSSAAFENNVECISKLVNRRITSSVEQNGIFGILHDVQNAEIVCSFDDDLRYWLCADDKVYIWDYTISDMAKPSWYYMTDIHGVCYFTDDAHTTHHLDKNGRVTRFGRYFSDYGGPINKEFQSSVMTFGTFDRLKDVMYIVFSVRSDTDTQVRIRYDTDYESRYDLTDVYTWDFKALPFNLNGTVVGYYNLERPRFAKIVKRKPMCRHIRHFSLFLGNNLAGEDLSIISAQIYYRFQGRER